MSSIEYTFDACGQVTAKDEYGIGGTEYTYDAEGQLTEVSYPSGRGDTFSYDNNGNRTEWTRSDAATTSYTYNAADQLTQSTEGTVGTSYSHDNNGNLTGETTAGVTKTFNYDAFDRMTSVVQGQSTLQSMTYGPDSKRLSLTDASGTRKFLYDGNDVIQEYDSDWSSVSKEYTHGPWVDEPLSMTDKTVKQAGDTYYLMKDRLGSIIDILDENETLRTTYSYDAFGEPTATYHSGQVDCMYRFTGRVYDTAMGNYFYRARYYNQSLGRFFSRDPIFSLGSLYSYCHNSPQNFTDPSGMHTDDWSAEYSTEQCGMGIDAEDNDTSKSTTASAKINSNRSRGRRPCYAKPDGKGGYITVFDNGDEEQYDPTHGELCIIVGSPWNPNNVVGYITPDPSQPCGYSEHLGPVGAKRGLLLYWRDVWPVITTWTFRVGSLFGSWPSTIISWIWEKLLEPAEPSDSLEPPQ